ncbi:DUF4382 domain-containing protein [Flavobacterium wongokense]|uniref:DUF4382 domain-containing protein n=1 Tax=Flavobacterium wongokense TaxID=2910674 RepID=UPI001F34466B|nr:DUF4382 domain-containing protein [Flavobacterium sp. WG47]MCF6132488.1 DUF4382 domain-containing protein [Flavobacterium sp. WG47]
MKKIIYLLCVAAGIVLYSCDSSSSDSADGSYSYKVRMTDAPGPYDAVNIDLRAVEVKGSNGQTVNLNTTAGIYNLLDFSNGVDTLIAVSTLADSRVEQIRLILGPNNSVVVDGVTYPLDTPSAEQSGLKLQVHQDLVADIENMVLIDFDANSSIHQTGNGTYKLKPVLRTIVTATTGNIKGVIPAGVAASVTATSSTGIDYSSGVNEFGQFQISGLTPGAYTVTVTPALPLLPIIQTNVIVNAGTTTNLGTLTF